MEATPAIILLGSIPVYIWNDVNWLPFQDVIDYDKLCVHFHISEIDKLEEKLLSIDEARYNEMLKYLLKNSLLKCIRFFVFKFQTYYPNHFLI